MLVLRFPYADVFESRELPLEFVLTDHICGFDQDRNNKVLHKLNQLAIERNCQYTAYLDHFYPQHIVDKYPHVTMDQLGPKSLQAMITHKVPIFSLLNYKLHPPVNHQTFLCSFNGTLHTSRKLLVAILHKNGYFDSRYCSKLFSFTAEELQEHIQEFVGQRDGIYNKFFISNDSDEFFCSKYTIDRDRYHHNQNIHSLESLLTKSFLHIVSETMATSYYPFVTEKFLYSVVTRGLFLSYAQPGWHAYIEKYYGFKPYNKLFDYRFDSIDNPVERLVELMCMISKFSKLSSHDWMDLYQMEADTIEYNYNHYLNGGFIKKLTTGQ